MTITQRAKFRLTITQLKDDKFEFHVSFMNGSEESFMSSMGRGETVQDCYRKAMTFAVTKLAWHRGDRSQLTERNLEIFRLVAVEGLAYSQIAEQCGIAEQRIKYHMGRVREVLNVASTPQAVFVATAQGLIP